MHLNKEKEEVSIEMLDSKPELFKQAKYEYHASIDTKNAMHVLVINFGSTLDYTKSIIGDLVAQDAAFDLTIADNYSFNIEASQKYFKLLCENWPFQRRALHIFGFQTPIPVNYIWNAFYEFAHNDLLCFLNNDVCVPENFVSDTLQAAALESNAGIINHSTNKLDAVLSKELSYKIYDIKSNAFLHRQGWDFTIKRQLYKLIPQEFTTYVGDDIQFDSTVSSQKDIVLIHSSPIMHWCSVSQKKSQSQYSKLLEHEKSLYRSSQKYLAYGNARRYNVDKSFSSMYPEDPKTIQRNLHFDPAKKVIVSFTTYPKRIQNVPRVLDSIADQTLKPSKIVVNLARSDYENENAIPENVLDFMHKHNVEINFVEEDTKVYKKIIPTLLMYPHDLILSIDDDFIYPQYMIQDFYQTYKQHPDNPISGNRVRMFRMQCHCGCASLVQYKFFGGFLDNYKKYSLNCPSSDIFFTMVAHANGYDYACTKNVYFNNMTQIKSEHSYSKNLGNHLIDYTYKYLKTIL